MFLELGVEVFCSVNHWSIYSVFKFVSTFGFSSQERMASLESDYKRTINALDLRVFQLETTSYNGILVWKFKEFSKHLENAQRGLKVRYWI